MSSGLTPLDGRLALKGLLGRGGMGEVHRAWDATLERAVAVKFLRPGDPRETERLLLEARLQARVDHPGIVRVLEAGSLEGRPCLVLQLVEGPSLALLAGELGVADLVEAVRQAASALHAAHLEGLIHRDVKPGNLLVERPRGAPLRAFVSDFGMARDEESGLSRTGIAAGTLDYMAPEQVLGQGPIDHRADVYGLGATLFALLAGRPPFALAAAGPDAGAGAALQRLLQQPPPPLPATTPRDLARVVSKALEKDPRDRYQSAGELAEDLARLQRGEPVRARPPPLPERAVKWARRNPVAARAVALGGLALLLAAGWAALAERRAGLEALEAARLGAEAQRMESALRLAHLAPAHDLTPAYAAIRAAVDALRVERGGAAPAARAFAIGRGLQLLGEADAARAALEEAWSLGFRRPEAARALGLLDAERYAAERAQLPRIDDEARKAARLAALRTRFADPAVARLRLAAAGTQADRDLMEAQLALVEERWDDAARLARGAGDGGADQLDAATVEGEARLRQGQAAFERRSQEETLSAMAAAAVALRRAGEIGRSAPRPRLLLAQALGGAESIREPGEPARADRYDAALAAADEGLRLDPRDPGLLLVRSELLADQGRIARRLGLPPGPPLADAVASADAATRLAPGSRRAWDRLAWACTNYARELRDLGFEVDWAVEKGIAAGRRAEALEPESSVPPSMLAGLHTLAAELAAIRGRDGRDHAEAALAAARRVVELGERPVVSRAILSQALLQDAVSRAGRGEESAERFAEAGRSLVEAVERGGDPAELGGYGVYVASIWAEVLVEEGRSPAPALAAGEPWLVALRAKADQDAVAAAQLGELAVIEAGGALIEGRDPSPELARALPLLDRSIRAGVSTALHGRLGEAELARAAWLARSGGDRRAALAAATAHAERMKAADPKAPDGWRLEAAVALATPSPAPAVLRRGVAAADRALTLAPGEARVLALRGLLLAALGDRDGARAALAAAEKASPRQVRVAELRARLTP